MAGMAETAFWACAGILIYVYFGYPLLLALMASFVRRPEPAADYLPTLSVLLCAYNEEAHIGQKIARTLKLDYPADRLEVVWSQMRQWTGRIRLSNHFKILACGYCASLHGEERRTPRTKELKSAGEKLSFSRMRPHSIIRRH